MKRLACVLAGLLLASCAWARGDAQIGFQQLSESKAAPGIDIVDLLPDAAQKVTVFSEDTLRVARRGLRDHRPPLA